MKGGPAAPNEVRYSSFRCDHFSTAFIDCLPRWASIPPSSHYAEVRLNLWRCCMDVLCLDWSDRWVLLHQRLGTFELLRSQKSVSFQPQGNVWFTWIITSASSICRWSPLFVALASCRQINISSNRILNNEKLSIFFVPLCKQKWHKGSMLIYPPPCSPNLDRIGSMRFQREQHESRDVTRQRRFPPKFSKNPSTSLAFATFPLILPFFCFSVK